MRVSFQDTTPRFWWVVGWVAGAFTLLLAAAIYFSIGNTHFYKEATDCLKEWQTLAAGILALGGAIWTVGAIRDQLQYAREQDEDIRERKNFADRAAMPSALVSLLDYAHQSIVVLKELRAGLQPSGRIQFDHTWVSPRIPDYPHEAASVLRTCLETADKAHRPGIVKVLRDLQIQNSRLRDIIKDVSATSGMIVMLNNLCEVIVNSLELYVRGSHMFAYARAETNAPAPPERVNLEDMGTRAFFEDLDETEYDVLYQIIRGRYSNQS